MTADDGTLWYKDAIIYQTHVKAFHDSDADGIGDFRGLTQKLDYLQDLGVTAIWLLPFYPSPLRDDGYDIADYRDVHASYGTLRDLRIFLREARRQGLRVITELVLNHTSDQHPWFRRARRAPAGSPERDFYVWSKDADLYREARIIFQDFEVSNWAWDSEVDAYYWHRFYTHQPDLNFENPAVHRAMLDVVDHWFEMGVDGLRLDAVPYLYEEDGTNCENLPRTHEFLRTLRRHVDDRYGDRMLLAEANQWPEDAVTYFGSGDGDECHMAFHFPVMPRMFMSIRMEDRFPIIDILSQTPPIPRTAQWAMFLRNHDELTLEMVTDEERDYMYRVYARDPQARINLGIRRRLAPLLSNDRKTIELMNALLYSLPGTPIVYYGDEIGMGDNIYLGDRNGVRTPMQWSPDRNAGFSRANPQRLYLPVVIDPEYHFESVNVEAQQNNPNSLLWWMKRTIALRKRYKAFGRGSIEFLYPDNRKVLVFLRRYEDEQILVVANLSRFIQYVELDLSSLRGMVPVELFSRNEFPAIGELPYFLTLGPHAFYWFALEPQREEVQLPKTRTLDVGTWHTLFGRRGAEDLEGVLPAYLRARRWFGGKARRVKSVEVARHIPVPASLEASKPTGKGAGPRPMAYLSLLRVEYTEGDPDTYILPLTCVWGERAQEIEEWHQAAIVARLRTRDGEQLLIDATWEDRFCSMLLALIRGRRTLKADSSKVVASTTKAFRRVKGRSKDGLAPHVLGAEQSNTSIVYGDRFILKLFRRPDEGLNPDLEIGRFLTEEAGFPHIAPVAGAIEYRSGRAQPMTLGVLQGFVPNEGDAWSYTVDSVRSFYEDVLALPRERRDGHGPGEVHLLDLVRTEPSPEAEELVGTYLESARLLGRRTAELHLALAGETEDRAFAPEPFTALYQRSLYQSMRGLVAKVFGLLRTRTNELPEAIQVLDLEAEIMDRFRAMLDTKVSAKRIRTHGDYHLGQVLYTGKDFVIIDFEGEPARPLSERRIKRSALRDVSGMLRSFHYAAYTPLFGEDASVRPEDPAVLSGWARFWYLWTSASFLGSYLEHANRSGIVPTNRQQLQVLLDAYLLEKAVYEVGYEANNRPGWLKIPIQGVIQLLEAAT